LLRLVGHGLASSRRQGFAGTGVRPSTEHLLTSVPGDPGLVNQPSHQFARIDVETLGEAQQTRQAGIPLAALDLSDKGEMEADPFSERHLTQPQFMPPGARTVAQLDLGCRATAITLESARHQPQLGGSGFESTEVSFFETHGARYANLLRSERSARRLFGFRARGRGRDGDPEQVMCLSGQSSPRA
jgi:hypothetical protein